MINCTNCGTPAEDGERFCKNCGTPIQKEEASVQSPEAAEAVEAETFTVSETYTTGESTVKPKKSGISMAALICGIAGIVTSCCGLGFIPSVVAIICGIIGMKKSPADKTFNLVGIICGAGGVSIVVFFFIPFCTGFVYGLLNKAFDLNF